MIDDERIRNAYSKRLQSKQAKQVARKMGKADQKMAAEKNSVGLVLERSWTNQSTGVGKRDATSPSMGLPKRRKQILRMIIGIRDSQ